MAERPERERNGNSYNLYNCPIITPVPVRGQNWILGGVLNNEQMESPQEADFYTEISTKTAVLKHFALRMHSTLFM